MYRKVREGVRRDSRRKTVGKEVGICPNEVLTVVRLVSYVHEGSFKLEVSVIRDLPAVQEIKGFEDDEYVIERGSYGGGETGEGLDDTRGEVVPQVAEGEVVVGGDAPCFTANGDWGDLKEVRQGLVTGDEVYYVERGVPEWGDGGKSRGVCDKVGGEGEF